VCFILSDLQIAYSPTLKGKRREKRKEEVCFGTAVLGFWAASSGTVHQAWTILNPGPSAPKTVPVSFCVIT